jgi:hypothetical protein
VAVAAVDLMLRSNTTSSCSAGSATGLVSIASSYNGSDKAYVGVLAQEVQAIAPEAVVRRPDGYLRVYYEKLGLQLQTYEAWIAAGARLPTTTGETRH